MDSLPSRFTPVDLARAGMRCNTILPISDFKRFSGLLMSDQGEVAATVRFGLEGKQAVARGTLETTAGLQCQRCLESVLISIRAEFAFGFVTDEAEADALADELDPLLLDEHGEISAVELLEDELILQVPARVVHSNEERCDPAVIEAVTAASTASTNRQNPFSDLGELLKN